MKRLIKCGSQVFNAIAGEPRHADVTLLRAKIEVLKENIVDPINVDPERVGHKLRPGVVNVTVCQYRFASSLWPQIGQRRTFLKRNFLAGHDSFYGARNKGHITTQRT